MVSILVPSPGLLSLNWQWTGCFVVVVALIYHYAVNVHYTNSADRIMTPLVHPVNLELGMSVSSH